jgi:hypothetical protein
MEMELAHAAEDQLIEKIRNGSLPLFVRAPSNIYRIPGEDINALAIVLRRTMQSGRFPEKPTAEEIESEAKWRAEDSRVVPVREVFAAILAQNPSLRIYCGARPLVKDEHVEVLFPQTLYDVPQRSGAPGKPSSMHIVLNEHKRRHDAGETASSREAEAEALEAWLKSAHPAAPKATAKTIRGNLPQSFQPFNGRRPK